MALIEIKADLSRVADALERIAAATEDLVEIQIDPSARARMLAVGHRSTKAGAARSIPRVSQPTDADLWEREQERERRAALGYEAATEQGTLPNVFAHVSEIGEWSEPPEPRTPGDAETGQQREQERERRAALGYESSPGPRVEQVAPELGTVLSYTEMFEDAETKGIVPRKKVNEHQEYGEKTGQQREP